MLLIGKGNSAKALREKLGLLTKVDVVDGLVRQRLVVRNLRGGRVRRDWVTLGLDDQQSVVCWGVQLPRTPAGPTLNGTIIMDKLDQLRRFWDAGVPIPTVALLNREGQVFTVAPAGVRDGRWLARSRHHRGGNDILGPMDFDELRQELRVEPTRFGVRYIEKTHEWRVHIFQGRVLRIARKVPNEGATVVWNQANSHFKYDIRPGPETLRQLTTLGTGAVAALGMDFGAVDIIKGQGGFYVLEVNSAPGISDNQNTLDAYVQAMRGWADAHQGRVRNANPQ